MAFDVVLAMTRRTASPQFGLQISFIFHLTQRTKNYRYGRLVRCDIPAPRPNSRTAYAFVEFEDPRDAEDAYHGLQGIRFEGSVLSLQWAKREPSQSWRYDGGRGRSRSPPRRRSLSPRHDRDDRRGGGERRDDRPDRRDDREPPARGPRDDERRDDRRDDRENGRYREGGSGADGVGAGEERDRDVRREEERRASREGSRDRHDGDRREERPVEGDEA
ncbi:hypothetical protein DFJ73DRAFT_182283 [Zopfochytrium polystomum]|nr:hypothetical protein DFJ73DRAFT_182283 [Zopfochytrium polystomum]